MSCCTLERAAITITNVPLVDFLLDDIETISGYSLLFEPLRIRDRPHQWDNFALTLTRSAVRQNRKFAKVIRDVVRALAQICKTRDQRLNLTIKLFDEGRFYLYYVVHNNRIVDLTGKIHGMMIATEAEELRHLGPRQTEPQDRLLVDELGVQNSRNVLSLKDNKIDIEDTRKSDEIRETKRTTYLMS